MQYRGDYWQLVCILKATIVTDTGGVDVIQSSRKDFASLEENVLSEAVWLL